jgi:hypothetical protein
MDILDCTDGTGHALAALRIGLSRLVLWPDAPGRDAVVAIAESLGGFVLAEAPQVDPPLRAARANPGEASTSGGESAEPFETGQTVTNAARQASCHRHGQTFPGKG